MEAVDRDRVVRAVYPVLLERKAAGMPDVALHNALAAAAEGYPFPTNLDRDQPVDGLTPASQADIVRDALAAGATPDDLAALLDGYVGRRASAGPSEPAAGQVVLVSGGTQGLGGRGASGTLVNISTMSAYGAQPHLAPYVAAKTALARIGTQQGRRRRLPADVGARPNPRI